MKLSKRAQQLTPSATLAITALSNDMRARGMDVVGLGAGEPDFNTPEHIIEAAEAAAEAGHTKYTAAGGLVELKEAIVEKFQRENSLSYNINQVVVTCGAKHALYNLFQVLIDPGDEVIIPAPYWVSYVEQVKLAGGRPVIIETEESEQFKVQPDKLKQAITNRTKLFLLNSPSNPTGTVYNRRELAAIGEVCLAHGVDIVSDEIYERLIYDGVEHVSIASLSRDLYEHTYVINGVSKTYAMTGWRIGYAAGGAEVMKAMAGISSHSTSNPTSVSQYAAYAAMKGSQEPVNEMKQAFVERRNYLVDHLNGFPGIAAMRPLGAFYVFANVSGAIEASGGKFRDANDWCKALLEEEQVAVVPGSAFGAPNHVRLSYATSMAQLQKAIERIERFLNKTASTV